MITFVELIIAFAKETQNVVPVLFGGGGGHKNLFVKRIENSMPRYCIAFSSFEDYFCNFLFYMRLFNFGLLILPLLSILLRGLVEVDCAKEVYTLHRNLLK